VRWRAMRDATPDGEEVAVAGGVGGLVEPSSFELGADQASGDDDEGVGEVLGETASETARPHSAQNRSSCWTAALQWGQAVAGGRLISLVVREHHS